jgi:hypothetical protein
MILDLYQYVINSMHQFFLAHVANAFIFSSILLYNIFIGYIFLVNSNYSDMENIDVKLDKNERNNDDMLSSASDL